MNKTPLLGKTVLVTGARRGIGRAIATKFAAAGADLALADIAADDGGLTEAGAAIKSLGRRAAAIQCDISQKDQVESMVRQTVRELHRLDVLVNCAGVWIPGRNLVDCPEEEWDKVIDTNLKGTYLCCQSAARVMMEQGSGNIINLSSQVGLNPGTGAGAYSISKAGIIMLTRQLALELASHHIRVNAIAPGIVKTDFNLNIWKNAENALQLGSSVPIGRLAEADDIAGPALFLASDESRYITGAVINVDGGWQAAPGRAR